MNQKNCNRMIDGVIFDVDGTLLDTMPVWHDAGARFLATLGIQAEPGLGDLLFEETVETGAQYLIDHYGLTMSIPEIARGIDEQVEQFYFREADFKPGARELLQQMYDAGIHLTVATSTHRRCIEAAFDRLGIRGLFEGIFTCSEVGATKNNPAIFYAAEDCMQTQPEYTWVFEDGLYAIRTAEAAGFRTVGVYDPVSEKDREEIIRTADFYYESLADFDLLCGGDDEEVVAGVSMSGVPYIGAKDAAGTGVCAEAGRRSENES